MVSTLDRQIIALMVEPIKSDLRLSDTEIGLLQGFAFAIFYSLAAIPMGWAVDRYPRRIIIYMGVTLWSLSAAACGLASNFWHLFLGRTLVGVGEATLTPASVSLISDLFPPQKMGTPMGIYAAGFYLGSGVALGIGGLIVGIFAHSPVTHFPVVGNLASWQAVFLITGLPGVLLAFLAFLTTDPRPPRRIETIVDRELRPSFIPYLVANWSIVFWTFSAFGIASLVAYAMGAWTPAYFARHFGWKVTEIGWIWGMLLAGSGATGALLGGVLVDRVNRAGVHSACVLVPAVSSAIAWPLVTSGYLLSDPIFALASLGLGMVALGVISAGSFATWQRIAPAALRGQLSAGFVLTSSLLGAGTGPLVVGFITDHVFHDEALVGWSLALTVGTGIPLIMACLIVSRVVFARLAELAACTNLITYDRLSTGYKCYHRANSKRMEAIGDGAMSFRERTIAKKVVGPTTIKLNDYEWSEGDEYRWSSDVHLMTWRMFPAIVSYEARLGGMEMPYGRLSFYPANTALRTNAARVSQCGRSITFQFDPTWFAETSGVPLDTNWIEVGRSLDINAAEMSDLFQKIGSEIQRPRQASDRLLQALCTSIAIDVSRSLDRSHASRNRTVNSMLTARDLQDIISHIEMNIDNYECDLSTRQLCKHFGMSATHLRRSFKSTTGQPLQSFISDLRLGKAKSMLAGPEPIKSIAFKLGFKEASAFSYAFKLKFGTTAGEYRAALSNVAHRPAAYR